MNNNAIYNAAVEGGGGGVSERWLTSQNSTDYTAIAAEVNNFALAVDSAVAAGTITSSEQALMQAICQGVTAGRHFGNQSSADFTAVARAIGAIFTRFRTLLQPLPGDSLTSPVYVENYLASNGNDLRLAMIAAQAANTANGITFIMPVGTFSWTAGTFFQPRNGTTWSCYGCTVELNMAGATSTQQFMFVRTETGVSTHADRIQIWGGRFRILNVVTSFFSAAVQFEASSNCVIKDAEAECTFHATATQGRIRWGFNLLGGDQTVDPTQGRNNRFENCTLRFSQIQGCGAGRSADGVTVINTQIEDAIDLAISVVSGVATQSLQNVSVINTQCRNAAGTGIVFVGTDGAGAGIGVGVLRNIFVDGVWLDGQRSTPDLDFPFVSTVIVDGGLVTENVNIGNIGSRLVPNASLQTRSVTVSSQTDEVSWNGLNLYNMDLCQTTTNDPIESLFVSGVNLSGCTCDNVTVRGVRGIRFTDCDDLVINNTQTLDGSLLITASGRNLTDIMISNSEYQRTTGFQATISFNSTAARNMSRVMLDNVVCNGNGTPITTSLGGGTMQMWLNNIENTSGTNPTAETLAGIIRLKNVRGFVVPVTKTVAVPAVAAGAVGYVVQSMVNTRLSDVALFETVVANPRAQLVAAGPGGAYVNCRVSVAGSIELAFIGPLGAANVDFDFDRVD